MRDGVDAVIVDAGHRLAGDERVDDCFFGRLHGRLEYRADARDSIDTCAASRASAAPAFAVEKAMKMSPDPLLDTLPVRASPSVARLAMRLS